MAFLSDGWIDPFALRERIFPSTTTVAPAAPASVIPSGGMLTEFEPGSAPVPTAPLGSIASADLLRGQRRMGGTQFMELGDIDVPLHPATAFRPLPAEIPEFELGMKPAPPSVQSFIDRARLSPQQISDLYKAQGPAAKQGEQVRRNLAIAAALTSNPRSPVEVASELLQTPFLVATAKHLENDQGPDGQRYRQLIAAGRPYDEAARTVVTEQAERAEEIQKTQGGLTGEAVSRFLTLGQSEFVPSFGLPGVLNALFGNERVRGAAGEQVRYGIAGNVLDVSNVIGFGVPRMGVKEVGKLAASVSDDLAERIFAASKTSGTARTAELFRSDLAQILAASGQSATLENRRELVAAVLAAGQRGAPTTPLASRIAQTEAARTAAARPGAEANEALAAARGERFEPGTGAALRPETALPEPAEIRRIGADLNRLLKATDVEFEGTRFKSVRQPAMTLRPGGGFAGIEIGDTGLKRGVTFKVPTDEFAAFRAERVKPLADLRERIVETQRKLRDLDTGAEAEFSQTKDLYDQLVWYEKHRPSMAATASWAIEQLRAHQHENREQIMEAFNAAVKTARTKELEEGVPFENPTIRFPEVSLKGAGEDAAKAIETERRQLQRQLIRDVEEARRRLEGTRVRPSGAVTKPVRPQALPTEEVPEEAAAAIVGGEPAAGIPEELADLITVGRTAGGRETFTVAHGTGTRMHFELDDAIADATRVRLGRDQVQLPGTPKAEPPTLRLESQEVPEAAARLTRVESEQLAMGGGGQPPKEPPKTAQAAPEPEEQPSIFAAANDPATTAKAPGGGDVDVEKLMADLGEPLDKRRGRRTHEMTFRAAAEAIAQGKVTLDALLMAQPGDAVNAELLAAADQIVQRAVAQVDQMVDTASTDDLLSAIMRTADARRGARGWAEEPGRATEIQKELSIVQPDKAAAKTDAGRITELLGMVDDETMRQEVVAAIRAAMKGLSKEERQQGLRNIARVVQEAVDESAAKTEWEKMLAKPDFRKRRINTVRAVIREVVRANLLSGLANVTNVIGNTAKVPLVIAKTAGEAAIESGRVGALRLAGREAERHVFWSELGAAGDMLRGIVPGMKRGWDTVVHGEYDPNRFMEFEREVTPEVLGGFTERIGLGKKLGERAAGTFLWGSRLAVGTDAIYKSMYEAYAIGRAARREASAKGLKGAAFEAHLAKRTAAPKYSTLIEAHRYADKETFNQAANRVAKLLLDARDIPVVGDALFMFMPFIATHSNILDEGIRWTPIGFGRMAAEWKTLPPVQRADLASRAALGTASMIALGATIMGTDNITGSGPLERHRKQEWLEGHQEYSVRVGGKWVSYEFLGPFAFPMRLMADYADAAKYDGEIPDERNLQGTLAHMARTIWGSAFYFEKMSQVLYALNSGDETEWARLVADVGREFVPQAGALGVVRNVQEPYGPDYDEQLPFEEEVAERFRGAFPGSGLPAVYERPRSGAAALSPIPFRSAEGAPADTTRQPFFSIPEIRFGQPVEAETMPTKAPRRPPVEIPAQYGR